MEGKFFLLTYRPEYLKHQLVLFMLDNGQYLVYHDTRRFGTFHLIPKKHHLLTEHLSHLGYEPFAPELKAGALQKQ